MTHHPELNVAVQRRLVAIRERLDELRQLEEVTAERVPTQLVALAAQVNTHIVAFSGKVPPAEYRESFIAAAEVGAGRGSAS